jgi:filamentous hemagglutinin
VGVAGDDKFARPATINVGFGRYLGVQITPSNTAAWNQLPWYDPTRYINAISAGVGAGVPYVPAVPGTISINPMYSPPGTGK